MGFARTILVVFFAAAGLSMAQAAGTMYKWVDSQGRVTYHDKPPPEGADYRVEQKYLGSGGSLDQGSALEKAVAKSPVVLYSIPVCTSCDLARLYLKKRKVPFTEHNVENNPAMQQTLKKKAGSLSAPTITIGEKVMVGYVESILEGELNDAGYPRMTARAGTGAGDEGGENREDENEERTSDREEPPAAEGGESEAER